jgi:hypothetical protein
MSNIKRLKREKNFTVVGNEILEDKNLEWNDLGILVFLLSKPDDWSVSTKHLQTLRKSGRDSIRASLNRIIDAGYMTRKPDLNKGWAYEISEIPIYKREDGKPVHGKPVHGKPVHIIRTDLKQELNTTVNTDNQQIVNTDITISTNSCGDLDGHSAKKFKKPTLIELEAFCNETNIQIDCQHFHDYYESNGWRVGGKAPMKSWQSAVRNWARNDKSKLRGNHATHRQYNKPAKLSVQEQFRKENGLGEYAATTNGFSGNVYDSECNPC